MNTGRKTGRRLMRYLIGDFTDRGCFNSGYFGLKFKNSVTKEELQKTKADDFFHVIDIIGGKFFDPEKNSWIEIEGGND